jgi:hypothetical protein
VNLLNTSIGISQLVIGTAYSALGLLSVWEVMSQYRYRGLSRFGLGFSLMAASCGPHHLVHGWCVLQGGAVSLPMLLATLIGLPAGAVFCWLRIEALAGGRGDRTIAAGAHVPVAVVVLFAMTAGALAAQTSISPLPPGSAICTLLGLRLTSGAAPGIDAGSLLFIANIGAAAVYSLVGWYIAVTQVRRYVTQRHWSLSGLALAAVFPTCAFMHVIHALTAGTHSATLPFDLLGLPASLYFLWVVKQVHRDSVVDWNRRPMVGVIGTPDRSSPWSTHSHRIAR